MPASKEIALVLSRAHKGAKQYGGNILHSADIERSDRELLVRTQWLQEIIKGWYMLVRRDINPGDSSAWFANIWDFLRLYLEYHYGQEYCLSSKNSLELHIGSTVIPKQIVIITARGGGKSQELLFDTSVFAYSDPDSLPKERVKLRGIEAMTLPYALCKVTPTYFKERPQEIEIALKSIRTSSELVQVIVKHKFKRAAARLIGAYDFLGDKKMAKTLEKDLAAVGMLQKAENPFEHERPSIHFPRVRSPYMARIFAMWNRLREDVILNFPAPSGLPQKVEGYLAHVDEIYAVDAYNSLSIEGYRVDQELIERVQRQQWNPEINDNDCKERNALAARGYFESYQGVKKSILKILKGAHPGDTIEEDLQKWFRALFHPSARSGIIAEEDLFGYRKRAVYIRNSRHVPLPRDALLDAMEAFFTCLKDESHPAVRAVLGHFIFVFIHPYMDGNGRIGRFLMNVGLASGGYPWTVIQVKHRKDYLNTLESASVEGQIIPFTQFVANEMKQNSILID